MREKQGEGNIQEVGQMTGRPTDAQKEVDQQAQIRIGGATPGEIRDIEVTAGTTKGMIKSREIRKKLTTGTKKDLTCSQIPTPKKFNPVQKIPKK